MLRTVGLAALSLSLLAPGAEGFALAPSSAVGLRSSRFSSSAAQPSAVQGFSSQSLTQTGLSVPPTLTGLRMAGGPAPGAESEVTSKLGDLIKECSDWGLVRFITVNPSGSVLETAADIGVNLNHFTIPKKGQYLTIASDDKTFECHLNLEKASKVTFSEEAAKIGGHTLYVMRVKGEDDGIMLSAMLQYDPSKGPGNYFNGAVDAFKAISDKYGPEMPLTD